MKLGRLVLRLVIGGLFVGHGASARLEALEAAGESAVRGTAATEPAASEAAVPEHKASSDM